MRQDDKTAAREPLAEPAAQHAGATLARWRKHGKAPFPNSRLRTDDGGLLTVFHGTGAEFATFRKPGFRNQQLGFGLHFAEAQPFAERYVRGKQGRLLECAIDLRNPLDVTGLIHAGTPAFELARALYKGTQRAHQWPMFAEGGMVFLNLDLFDPKRVMRMIREAGFDGVTYTARYGRPGAPGMGIGPRTEAESRSHIVFEPEQVHILRVIPATELAAERNRREEGDTPKP